MNRHIPGTIPPEFHAEIERALPIILKEFGTPCMVYSESCIEDRGDELWHAMRHVKGFQQLYAVKAWNNPVNLRLQEKKGFGFDVSSPYELHLMEEDVNPKGSFILTSNNSDPAWFDWTQRLGGIINLDDYSLIKKVRNFPETICFRLNPGRRKSGTSIIGEPVKAKYGIMWSQLIPAYREARRRGAKKFGLHMMVCSNCRDEDYIIDTARMGFEAIDEVERATGIHFDFFDTGGGFGIPYKHTDKTLSIQRIGERLAEVQDEFCRTHGYAPDLWTEMGRWMTGPFGALLVSAINRKDIYEVHIGVDAGMEALARPALYGAYHHVEVWGADRRRKFEKVNIVGSICENWDRLANHRRLPVIKMGDVLAVANCGAHAIVMASNYNGKTRPKELLIKRSTNEVELIRRAETFSDLDATLRFPRKVVSF